MKMSKTVLFVGVEYGVNGYCWNYVSFNNQIQNWDLLVVACLAHEKDQFVDLNLLIQQ